MLNETGLYLWFIPISIVSTRTAKLFASKEIEAKMIKYAAACNKLSIDPRPIMDKNCFLYP